MKSRRRMSQWLENCESVYLVCDSVTMSRDSLIVEVLKFRSCGIGVTIPKVCQSLIMSVCATNHDAREGYSGQQPPLCGIAPPCGIVAMRHLAECPMCWASARQLVRPHADTTAGSTKASPRPSLSPVTRDKEVDMTRLQIAELNTRATMIKRTALHCSMISLRVVSLQWKMEKRACVLSE